MSRRRPLGTDNAAALRRGTCRICGAEVDTFRDTETGLRRTLEPGPLPIDADLTDPDLRHRLWEHRGPRLGWVAKWAPAGRGWRELRATHRCADHTTEHRNSKE